MVLIDVKTDNVTDYKKTSLLLVFPYCSGKCGPECQNISLIRGEVKTSYITATADDISDLYYNLKTHEAVVMAGLEPFDSFDDVLSIVESLCKLDKPCDIVIYTGYNKEEYEERFQKDLLKVFKSATADRSCYKKLIVKIGRYDSNNKQKWHSNILGVDLATKNQYVISYDSSYKGCTERYSKSKEINN